MLALVTPTTLVACGGGNGFNFLGELVGDSQPPCAIDSAFPDQESVRVAAAGATTTTFVAAPNRAGCNVTYRLNGVTLAGTGASRTLTSSSFTAGSNTLIASVSDGTTTAERSWTVTKNTPPTCASQLPSTNTSAGIGGNVALTTIAMDGDADPVSFTWKVNGTANSPLLSALVFGNTTQGIFSPTVAQAGSNAVSVDLNDGYDVTSCGWNVTVAVGCSLLSASPSATTTKVSANGSTITPFAVTPSDVACGVTWQLNGASTGATGSSTTVTSSELMTGSNILVATISNGSDVTQRTWIVTKNTVPSCSSQTPAATGAQVSLSGTLNMQAVATNTDGDPLTFGWQLNGVTSPSNFNITNSGATSSAVFSPSNVGLQNVATTISDGYDSASCNWSVTVLSACAVASASPSVTSLRVPATGTTSTSFAALPNDGNCIVSWELNGSPVGTSGPLFSVLSSTLNPGSNALVATLSNGVSSASRSWTVIKNTPPSCASQSPAQTGTVMNFTDTQVFVANATDADSDPVSFSWRLDGATAPGLLTVTPGTNTSSALFTPGFTQIGSRSIASELNDGYDSAMCTWSAQVVDPATVTITACLPSTLSTPVGARSIHFSAGPDSSRTYTVGATGTGLTYRWLLNGTQISGATGSSLVRSNTDFPTAGNHTLVAEVTDLYNNVASCTFHVRRNMAPTMGTSVPPNATNVLHSISRDLSISASVSDGNTDDTLSYVWTLDGATDASLPSGAASTTFSPGSDPIYSGLRRARLTVSDGFESTFREWNVEVNYFSDECNKLTQNNSCTSGGMFSVGNTLNPLADPARFRMTPRSIVFDTYNNAYIADTMNHVIWYWNRTVAPSITVQNVTVAVDTMAIIVGTGSAGYRGESGEALRASLNTPVDIAVDPEDNALYISDWANWRVRRVVGGVINPVFGGNSVGLGGSHADGAGGTAHRCANPAGLAITTIAGTKYLYVACYSNHVIKRLNLSTNTGERVMGIIDSAAGTVGDWNGSTGGLPLTDVRLNAPTRVRFDPDNNLYVLEGNGYRLRVLNAGASPITFFGALTVPAGRVMTLLGNSAGNTLGGIPLSGAEDNVFPTSGRIRDVWDLLLTDFAASAPRLPRRLFVVEHSGSRVRMINNSTSPITLGVTTVAANTVRRVMGNQSAGYSGEGIDAANSRLNGPLCLALDAASGATWNLQDFLVCDSLNNRLRRVFNADHTLGLIAGNGLARSGFIGDSSRATTDVIFNGVRGVLFDSVNRLTYFTDSNNSRIRRVSRFGQVETVVARAAGDGNVDDEFASNVFTRTPSQLTLHGNHVVFADTENSVVRVWNRGTSPASVNGVYVSADRVSTLAGICAAGCNGTGGLDSPANGDATSRRLNRPEGVASDGTRVFIADTLNHCIRQVDASGQITTVAGVCGTAGNTNVLGVTAVATSVQMNQPAYLAIDANGGLYIVDRTNNRVLYFNRTGSSRTIAGQVIPDGRIGQVACGGVSNSDNVTSVSATCNQPWGVAARTGQFCFSNRLLHNVRCVNTSTGLIRTVFGPQQGDFQAGATLHLEQENQSATLRGYLNEPMGLSFDTTTGDLYIADSVNSLIRRVKLDP